MSETSLQLSPQLQRFCIVAAVLLLFTTSFDILLVVNAGGNYRFCQIMLLPLVVLALIKAFRGRRIPMLGAAGLAVWFLFQIAFIPVTDFWPKSLGYCLWLLLNIGLVFAFVQLFSENTNTVITLLRWYLYSFACIAIFGIIQFMLPLFGLPGPLVQQWFVPGTIARANGFTYEPSYFACYLLIGFVLVSSLRRSESTVLSRKALRNIYYLTGAGIIVSTSRLGIIFLLIEIFLASLRPWLSFLNDVRKQRMKHAKVRPLIPSLLSVAFVLTLWGGALYVLENDPLLLLVFLNGTGISDTPAHSVVERESAFQDTVDVFLQHPIIGRGLGGMSAAIAENEGNRIRSFEDAKVVEGMSVFTEVLAASGVVGVIPFIYFVVATIRKPLQLARSAPTFYSALLRGFVRSLIFAWAILQFNQNVLRTYLWAHIALLATVYATTLRITGNQIDEQPLGT